MNKNKILIILILILFLIVIIKYSVNSKSFFTNIIHKDISTTQFGNQLSYFFITKCNIIINKPTKPSRFNLSWIKTGGLYKKLDNHFILTNEQIKKIKNINTSKFAQTSAWDIFDYNSLEFWKIIKPNVVKSLDFLLKDIEIPKIENIPIIHFRCSDVPFNNHNNYHFSKYKYYKWCNQKLNNKYKKWYIITESKEGKCQKYINDLIKYIKEELNIKIKQLQIHTPLEDFKILYNAPIIIQGGCGGSFNFFSGFFKGTYLFTDVNKNELLNLDYDINIDYYKNGILTHKDVKAVGGYNTKEVIKLLRS